MLVLGIDTSTRYASIALVKNGNLLSEYTWECTQNHSVSVIPALKDLLEKTGVNVNDIKGIGVATGPGTFNGLRVSLSIAKSLAFSLGIPIVGIPTLEALACIYALPGIIVAPIIKSSRDMLAIAFYKTDANSITELKAPFLTTIEGLVKTVKRKTIFCGDLDNNIKELLSNRLGSKAIFPLCQQLPTCSTVIARKAAIMIKAGQVDDVHTLEPFYLKKPHITKPKNKKAKNATSALPSKAVLWDMDGVIVDSASYHLRSWQEAFKPHGITFQEDYFWQTFGMHNHEIVSGLNLGFNDDEIQTVIKTKEEIFRQIISQGIEPLPGAVDLIIALKKRRISMAIASSAPLENIICILNTLGIRQFFRALVGEEDVSRGKPDPEVFLKAAEKVRVKPEKCIVIEDAVAGVSAAKKAHMACVAVTNTNSADSLKEADLVISSLECINTEDLLGLVE